MPVPLPAPVAAAVKTTSTLGATVVGTPNVFQLAVVVVPKEVMMYLLPIIKAAPETATLVLETESKKLVALGVATVVKFTPSVDLCTE